jgi:hypothetical protein
VCSCARSSKGAYTYFNKQTGNEFSAMRGFTYNFENEHTQYQNGIDMHLDVGASKFVIKQLRLGAVGYLTNSSHATAAQGIALAALNHA